jgi:hypothetical protein
MPQRPRTVLVFAAFWLVLFALYLSAAKAGWVSDTLGWLEALRTLSFSDFVSRKGFNVPSYYQLTQAVTWSLYQIFGANSWAWHLLQLSLHALNAALLYMLLRGLFQDADLAAPQWPALVAAALFCLSPAVSEVIVWEAAFHFLQGMLLLLLQMHLLRRQLHQPRAGRALLACSLFALSLFSLEYFYLVPLLSAGLCLFYGVALHWQTAHLRKAWRGVVVPQAVLLLLYFGGLQFFAKASTGRLGNEWLKLPIQSFLVKPPEYVFHLFGGRFLPQAWRDAAYAAAASYPGAAAFYGLIAALLLLIAWRFRKMSRRAQVMSLLLLWLLAGLALESALWFPQRLLIIGDRYLYLLLPPFCGMLALAVASLRSIKLRMLLLVLLLLPAAALTFFLNEIWQRSQRMTHALQQSLSDAPDKITILLNNPASLRGALMIGAGSDGEARLMHNLFYRPAIRGVMYDAPAQNLLGPGDSVRIEAIGDRSIRVSLTRPGAFWQFSTDVAHSFSTPDFSVLVKDPDYCYVLRLTRPAEHYRLLYQQGGQWRHFTFTATH